MKKKYPFILVFCESVRTLIHKVLFEQHSPLYGRLDQKLQLNPLDYYTLRWLFYDHNVSKPDQHLRLFSMFGTNPRFYEILAQFMKLRLVE